MPIYEYICKDGKLIVAFLLEHLGQEIPAAC